MTQQTFCQLSRNEQLAYTKEQGRVLKERTTPNHQITLLQVGNFFVEIWMNHHSQLLDSLVSYRHSDLLLRHYDDVTLKI